MTLTDAGEYEIVVTGSNGGTPETMMEYTITVTKLARVDSSDATLSDIELTAHQADAADAGVDLAPTFENPTRLYEADVDYLVTSVTVAAPATDTDNADVVITPEDAEAGGEHQVTLVEGDNVIEIEVTAEDGTTRRPTRSR